jgi:hypothetical protein
MDLGTDMHLAVQVEPQPCRCQVSLRHHRSLAPLVGTVLVLGAKPDSHAKAVCQVGDNRRVQSGLLDALSCAPVDVLKPIERLANYSVELAIGALQQCNTTCFYLGT